MQNDIFLPWPPPYAIKRHPRTKRVKLKISAKKGLELLLPPNFSLKNIPAILAEHEKWIKKQLLELATQDHPESDTLPDEISLQALNQVWSIEYVASNIPLRLISRPHQHLAMMGKIQDTKICKKLLGMWVKKMAQHYLPIKLKELSLKMNLSYQKVSVRGQQTRWGSCSRDKTISLNYKLLFLPPHLMEHILIHELCHLVQLNHSEKFWRLVAKFDPNWQEHRQLLRTMNQLVPRWAE